MAKLIVFDIDGTITKHVSSWQYLHEHLRVWDRNAERYQKRFLAGKISYPEFCRLDARHWKGLSEERVRKIFKRIPYTKNARRYIPRLKQRGCRLAALSTGLHFNAERIKRELGLDYVRANRLLSRGGILTGEVRIDVRYAGKGTALKDIAKRFRCRLSDVICVGDGEGDVPMAKLAGYVIAFNSTSKALSRLADYRCRSGDFKDVYNAIIKH